MKSTPLTQGLSMLILAVYILYGFIALPFAGFILSFAAGLLSYGVSESFEISVSSIILTGVMFSLISKSTTAEEEKHKNKEGFTDGSSVTEIVNRLKKGPKGLFTSGFVEGFADADESLTKVKSESVSKTTDNTSKPASVDSIGVGNGIVPPMPPAIATAVKAVSGFKEVALPSEEKEGFYIDQGTTVMNALNALKPDQITAMSQDTQKLIDTQKSLMTMLSSMKPMLNDGKQMMDTFQQMFGQTNGVTGTSPPLNIKL
jgi:hypothetical protein